MPEDEKKVEKDITLMDDKDINLLKKYGLGPYAD